MSVDEVSRGRFPPQVVALHHLVGEWPTEPSSTRDDHCWEATLIRGECGTDPNSDRGLLELRPQREMRVLPIEAHPEDLVQLDLVALEVEPGAGEVDLPDLRPRSADLGDRLVPVGLEVAAPSGAGHAVVLAEVLEVAHLEAGVLHVGGKGTSRSEFAIRE